MAGETRRKRHVGLIFGIVGSALVAAAGVAIVVIGLQSHPPAPAPLPAATFDLTSDALPPVSLPPLVKGKPPTVTGDGCSTTVGPARLVIGSLCVDAPVVMTPGQPDAELTIPLDVHTVGQWNKGAPIATRAGGAVEKGTTLLAGHVHYAGQGNGALFDLATIAPGAVVHVSDKASHVTRWRVVSLQVVEKARLPASVFAGRTGPRRLIIVTCGGPVEYVPGYGNTYRDNVIVTTVPVDETSHPAR